MPADALAFYGRAVPWPWFGLAAEREGVVVGLGGVVWRDGQAFAFLDCPRRYIPAPLRATRLAKVVLSTAHAAGEGPIYVVPNMRVPTAKRWLAALGFVFERRSRQYEVLVCRAETASAAGQHEALA